jgi:hypothetical protein
MKITVLGTGNIGGTLGRRWAAKGHAVQFGARDATGDKYQALLESIEGQAAVAPIAEVLAFGEVITLAIPGAAVDDIVAQYGQALDGKIIIDATNSIGQPQLNSLDAIAAKAPKASRFRAFNSLGWENFDRPQLGGLQVDLFYCGDPGPAQQTVHGLIADIGLRPIYIGGMEQVEVVDNLARLWFALVFGQGYGRRLAFKLLME